MLAILVAIRAVGRWRGVVRVNHEDAFNFSAAIFKTETPGLLKGGVWRDDEGAPMATVEDAFLGLVHVRGEVVDLFVRNRSLSLRVVGPGVARTAAVTRQGERVSVVASEVNFRAWIEPWNVTVEGVRTGKEAVVPQWAWGFVGGVGIGVVIALAGRYYAKIARK